MSENFYNPENDIKGLSKDELIAQQTDRLKHVLEKVYDRVPFYRAKFDAHGVHPEDFKELSDIEKFPFTTKDDLRKNYPFGLFAEPVDRALRVHASSGTTGKSTIVGYTANDIDNWSRVMARSMHMAGVRRSDKVLVSYGYGLFTGGLGAHYGAEKLGAMVIPMSGGNTEKQIQLIQDLTPDVIMVTPSYLLNIIEVMKSKGLDLSKINLRLGILGAEPWTEQIRKKIESEIPLKAIDIYGLSEIIGPGVAIESLEDPGKLHLWEDHFYPEVIDTSSKRALENGERGELILTSLTKEAMPLIRYRTRDITTLNESSSQLAQQLPEQLPFRTIDKILGRNDDMFIIRGVNVFPSQIEEILMQFDEVSPTYLLEVNQKQVLAELIIKIELIGNFSQIHQESLVEKITKKIKQWIGISTTVEICPAFSLERSIGKAKRVVYQN